MSFGMTRACCSCRLRWTWQHGTVLARGIRQNLMLWDFSLTALFKVPIFVWTFRKGGGKNKYTFVRALARYE